jgi:hypothetical protein
MRNAVLLGVFEHLDISINCSTSTGILTTNYYLCLSVPVQTSKVLL